MTRQTREIDGAPGAGGTAEILGARTNTEAAPAYLAEIQRLNLAGHAEELDRLGYTVVPPEAVRLRPGLLDELVAAVLRVAAERTGVQHALNRPGDRGRYHVQVSAQDHYVLFYLLFEDPAFEEWIENPVLRALMGHAMGGPAYLSNLSAFVKWHGSGYGSGLGIHSDSPAAADGRISDVPLVCNSHLLLTDYTERDGALAVVPGSHHLRRQPCPGEGLADAIAIQAPAGSLVFWAGPLWHGAYPRQTPGLRLNLTTFFCHRAMQTQERYGRAVPGEMLARHDRSFAQLLGLDRIADFGAEGPDIRRAVAFTPFDELFR